MMKTKTNPLILFLAILTLTSLSCSLVSRVLPDSAVTPSVGAVPTSVPPTKFPTAQEQAPTDTAPDEKPTPTRELQTENPTPTSLPEKPDQPPVKVDQLVRQWATAGEATSEYGSDDWSAMQAAGEPNTPDCGDSVTAWAASDSDTVESITLYYYEAPLVPTEINIVQSYNPSQVVKVEVLDPSGGYETVVFEAEPKATDECPYTLSIPVTDIDTLVMGVRITIDQSVLGLGWNEIDAVELVGYAEAGYEPQPTKPSASGDNIWENVQALPIYPSAENVNYVDEMILSYTVSDSNRDEVLDFVLQELENIGWLTDVDEDGKCRDEDRCTSKLIGLDYDAADNQIWFLIHLDSPDAVLTLTLAESGGIVVVALAMQ